MPWQTTVRGLLEVSGFPTGTAIATLSGKKADRMATVARARAALLLFGLFCLLLVHRTQAQTEPPAASERGLFDLSAWTAGATGKENTGSFTEAQILSTGVFFGWVIVADAGSGWRRGGLEYGFNLLPAVVQFAPRHVFGGGFEPIVLRWNSSHHGRRSPFIELAGGALITNSDLPPGDTSAFNFTVRAGGGMAVSTTKHQSFDVACRWSHISNANLGQRNPQFNGLQLSVGYHWFK
jgi:hypothetical protein